MANFGMRCHGLLLVWLCLSMEAQGCLWIRGTTIDGAWVSREGSAQTHSASHLQKILAASPEEALHYIEDAFPRAAGLVERSSDEAVAVLMRGNPEAAATSLEALEKSTPGRYTTAANLGTAYELAGDDAKALEWIREGIRRNPDSHMRTEWLHARILEAKLKLKEDRDWFTKHTITGMDFARLRDSSYKLETLQGPMNAQALADSLWNQTGVRMLFVKPRDPIVAQLLLELALVQEQTGVLEEGLQMLELAGSYGLAKHVSDPLREKWEGVVKWAGYRRALSKGLMVAAVLLGPLLIILGFRWLWRVRQEVGA